MRLESLWQLIERVTTVATLVAAVAITWSVLAKQGASAQQNVGLPSREASGTIPADVLSGALILGSSEAKLAIVEFSDYECPFCKKHQGEVKPAIRKAFVDTGKAKYIVLNLPLSIHPNAPRAAAAGSCAGEQGRYAEMHERLFQPQRGLSQTDLLNDASELGLDLARFESCLLGGAKAKLERQSAVARQLGIIATPGFILGTIQRDGSVKIQKRIDGALPYDVFATALEDL